MIIRIYLHELKNEHTETQTIRNHKHISNMLESVKKSCIKNVYISVVNIPLLIQFFITV